MLFIRFTLLMFVGNGINPDDYMQRVRSDSSRKKQFALPGGKSFIYLLVFDDHKILAEQLDCFFDPFRFGWRSALFIILQNQRLGRR